ncbi:MAG: Holliday junction resolvase RuvX [Flavobacteriales bacterium]|nr:Holliday junction resolvase RuvX [Flavobacteriales bacterium]
MAKIMALDYGLKRVGIAATDDLQIIASAIGTQPTAHIWEFLKTYLAQNQIEAVVLGDPKNLDGSATDATAPTEAFANEFRKRYPEIELHRMNEVFTSRIARQTMVSGGMKKKQRQQKGMVDQISATIILQDFLSRRSNGLF